MYTWPRLLPAYLDHPVRQKNVALKWGNIYNKNTRIVSLMIDLKMQACLKWGLKRQGLRYTLYISRNWLRWRTPTYICIYHPWCVHVNTYLTVPKCLKVESTLAVRGKDATKNEVDRHITYRYWDFFHKKIHTDPQEHHNNPRLLVARLWGGEILYLCVPGKVYS